MAPRHPISDRNYKKLSAKELEALVRKRNLVDGNVGTKLNMINRLISDDKRRDATAKANADAAPSLSHLDQDTTTLDINFEATTAQSYRVRAQASDSSLAVNVGERIITQPAVNGDPLDQIPIYYGLKDLQLELSDIKFKIRSYDEPGDNLARFPQLSTGAIFPVNWHRKLVTFELPLTSVIQDRLLTKPGKKLIIMACLEVWAQTDGMKPGVTQFKDKVIRKGNVVHVEIMGWSPDGLLDFSTMMAEHTQRDRTIWTTNLPLTYCMRHNHNGDFTPGDYIHKWKRVIIMFSYILRAELAVAAYSPEGSKLVLDLNEKFVNDIKADWESALKRLLVHPRHNDIFEAGPPVADIFFCPDTDLTNEKGFVAIRNTFRIPRKTAVAIERGEIGPADMDVLRLFMPHLADTVRETLIAKRDNGRMKDKRKFIVVIETFEDDCPRCSIARELCGIHSHATSDSRAVIYVMQLAMTRQECALLACGQNRELLSFFVNRVLCFWRNVLRPHKGHDTLRGEILLCPTSLSIKIWDTATKEQDLRRQLDYELPSPLWLVENGDLFESNWGLPGPPDFDYPLSFRFLQNAKASEAANPDAKIHDPSEVIKYPSPEDMDQACLDLMKEIYSMAGNYLDTLLAMERDFPERFEDFRKNGFKQTSKNAENYEPDDFSVFVGSDDDPGLKDLDQPAKEKLAKGM